MNILTEYSLGIFLQIKNGLFNNGPECWYCIIILNICPEYLS